MVLRGSTEPRLFTAPLRELTPETSLGFAVIEFAEDILGIDLLPWQRWLFIHALELRPDGRLRFRTVLVLVARQNGKTTWAQVLSLFRMYVSGVKLVLGTAQDLDIAQDVWEGAVEIAEGMPELQAEIDKIVHTNGKHALELTGRRRYKVKAASRKGGRGLSGDLVLLDELREHTNWEAWGALTKTTMARGNAQVVGLSNAGDDSSVVLNHLRAQALKSANDPESDLFLAEWSAPDDCDLGDPGAWAQANPSLGYQISEDAIRAAFRTDPPHVFQAEVLCQRAGHGARSPYPNWPELATDSRVKPGARVAWGVDKSWLRPGSDEQAVTWIAGAALLDDGRVFVEVAASGVGVEWALDWMAERVEKWEPVQVAVQAQGAPISSALAEIEQALGTRQVMRLGSTDLGAACGMVSDLVAAGQLVHSNQPQLTNAAQFAATRTLRDAWVIDRQASSVDVAPLMAAVSAVYALRTFVPDDSTAERKPRSGAYAFF